MGYERHRAMTRPAMAGAAVWRTALGAIVTLAVYVALIRALVYAISALSEPAFARQLIDEVAVGDTPRGAIILLFSFAFLAIGPALVARPLHARSWLSYFGPPGQATWDFLLTVRALAILLLALWILLPQAYELDRGLDFGRWMTLLPLTALAILVQTGAEEVAFRGYLQSQLAARFRSPLVWMLLPSALFALGHYAPAETGGNALWFAVLAFAYGIAAADLTARTGSLGAAMGFHFANNMLALGATALPGPLSGLALFTYPFAADNTDALGPLIFIDFGVILLSWLATRLALRV
jgi:membrane protease YdiL (CAAX protease family)